MKRLSQKTKLCIIGLFKKGNKLKRIQRLLHEKGETLPKGTISYWIKKFKDGLYGEILDTEVVKKNRPSVVSIAHQQIIKNELKDLDKSSRQIYAKLKDSGAKFSLKTTQRAIRKAGFIAGKIRYGQMVREPNKLKRTDFCKLLLQNNEKFDDVIFSDETTVQLHCNKMVSYRPIGKTGKVYPKPKHPLKLHVWGAISRRGASKLLIFEDIMESSFFTENILQKTLLPFIETTFPDGHRFQQDHDPKHRSKLASNFMLNNNINWWKEWPAESPDLNPIEMCWNQLKRNISKKNPRTKADLVQCIQDFWKMNMTKEQCNLYIDHVFKVVPICIFLNGAATGDLPNRAFREKSRGKSIRYFQKKLEGADISRFVTM